MPQEGSASFSIDAKIYPATWPYRAPDDAHMKAKPPPEIADGDVEDVKAIAIGQGHRHEICQAFACATAIMGLDVFRGLRNLQDLGSPEVAKGVVEDGKAIAIGRGRGQYVTILYIVESFRPVLELHLHGHKASSQLLGNAPPLLSAAIPAGVLDSSHSKCTLLDSPVSCTSVHAAWMRSAVCMLQGWFTSECAGARSAGLQLSRRGTFHPKKRPVLGQGLSPA